MDFSRQKCKKLIIKLFYLCLARIFLFLFSGQDFMISCWKYPLSPPPASASGICMYVSYHHLHDWIQTRDNTQANTTEHRHNFFISFWSPIYNFNLICLCFFVANNHIICVVCNLDVIGCNELMPFANQK